MLAYHLVGEDSGLAVDVARQSFESQMTALREMAEPVSLAALWEVRGQSAVRPRVAVTFDDAFQNFTDVALPILVQHAIPVTLFVPVGFVEGCRGSPFGRAWAGAAMSWSALEAAAASELVTVGSHSWSHADLRTLPSADLRDDLERARETLERRLGGSVCSFCYPRGLWNSRVEQEVARVYSLAVMGGGRRVRPDGKPMRVERTSIRRDTPSDLRFLLQSVCVEEWLADRVRRLRR